MDEKLISRREAMKVMGTAAVATAAVVSGAGALASCTPGKSKEKKDMKVLLLNGSPRHDGNTATLLEEVAQQLSKHGIGSEVFNIGSAPVRGCIACGQCHAQGLGKCVFDDDVCNELISKMDECDAIIVGSPVYYGTPAGQVLSVLQRMAYAAGRTMQGKPASAITVCRRGGASAAFQTLQMPFQMLNMPIVTSQYWNIAYGSGKGEVSQDAEGLQTVRTLADNMAYMLKQFATGEEESPKREPWITTNFIR
ncbi:MAG: flavodoxin family protein [Bacteroidales bacterium]|nr:flavodoxin family protein [Bacteroidales bacterium]